MSADDVRILYEGKYLNLVARGKWEFVRRTGSNGVVGILAVTDEGRLILVEQYRPPIARPSIELPAGLVGDVAGASDESLMTAARRELFEETGYEAAEMIELAEGVSSAGMSDEMVTLMLARGLKKNGRGGGDASEKITVHEVPVGEVHAFLQQQARAGKALDFKIYAGLYLLQVVDRRT
ncbi:MAG TPA: NUDIX hydrolase [Phycisphaerae bacterium]|jgi:ADP-ribose pyrophosphatase|nr:NUDIX hydrolase [Phycisphaerae bacterium]HOB76637.1 NUDIX hydrolase [Phycisphaerae bacterium]HOJ55382.1 NUDIX hydrolase [Phycisphaerae bacterium]HOL24930.1 NUDIX hydrolase [Phycisphaerae bacterium]HPP20032.1 NUDIX hydrolase [Phycisphaerae bacterium]